MVLATAAFVALPLPSGCDVPTGVLNSTGVMTDERFEEGVHGLLGHRGRDRHRWR